MKNINKILMSALVASAMVGCNDLDTEPLGRDITTEEKEDAISSNPELSSAGVVAISSSLYKYPNIFTEANNVHSDFGWPAVTLMLDSRGMDMVGYNTGYNWFSAGGAMSDCTNNSYTTRYAWNTLYKQVLNCNTVLQTMPEEITDPLSQFYAAQALAARAFDYFMLAQMYQHTYVGSESMACVPIITEDNQQDASTNGIARSSVQEVYDQVMSDINEAIGYLDVCGITPEGVLDSGAKRYISAGAAYGLRARINLVMNKWADAENDARAAITKSGATPYSLTEASVPGFSKLDDHNVMWGISVAETDRVVTTGICNWPSHMGSLNYGYASVGAWRKVNIALFNSIPATDVRKGWFLDAAGSSPNLTARQLSYLAANGAPAYAQVKFGPYQDVLGTSNNACDIPLMRVEEMYLIVAEAMAMGGDPAGAASYLANDFVKPYRNPSYSFTSSSAEAVQNEVWNQRRVELWGEGISFFDIVRLKKPIDRRGGGWTAEWVFNVPGGAQINVFPIPQTEINSNQLISAGNNNEAVAPPTAVSDN